MLKVSLIFTALGLATPAIAFEYTMVKGDTLWSLSERYLKDPYLWPRITYLDGSVVTEPRRMPIGTLLLIPKEIANERAEIELTQEIDTASDVQNQPETNPNSSTVELAAVERPNDKPFISNPSLQAMVERLNEKQRNRLWDYWLKDNNGLVRTYYNGQEVVIEAQILIEEMRHMESKSK